MEMTKVSNQQSANHDKPKVFRNIFKLARMVWNFTPGYMVWMVMEGLIWGCNHAIGIIYIERLFNSLSRGDTFRQAAGVILMYALYNVVFLAFHHWYWNYYNPKQREKLSIKIHNRLFEKAVGMDISRYEDPDFYNDFVWSMDSSTSRVVNLIEDTGKLINRLMTIVIVVGVLTSIDLLMACVIFFSAILNTVFVSKGNTVNMNYSREVNEVGRRNKYVNRVFSLPDYAKELRTSDISRSLLRDNDEAIENLNKLAKKYANKKILVSEVPTAFSTIIGVGLVLLLLYKVMVQKSVELGGLAVAMSAYWKIEGTIIDMTRRVMKYHEHGIFTEKMFRFLECQNKVQYGESEAGELNSVELRNVSFGYVPDKPILKNVNMTIRRGERIAIVGYNGAGKTTLTKLLLRLYDPDNGEIIFNGGDMKTFSKSSINAKITSVFQDYHVFACTLAENVCGGEYDDTMKERVLKALGNSDFSGRLSTLENGLKTMLTREFDNDGIQLSGGETQKVAIARALFKDADLLILDEPSSALDPDSEYALNESIMRCAVDRGKTVIIISHRLSTTRGADRIYVFDNGEIVEQGTHNELMQYDNLYSNMFRVQAEKYQRSYTI